MKIAVFVGSGTRDDLCIILLKNDNTLFRVLFSMTIWYVSFWGKNKNNTLKDLNRPCINVVSFGVP